MTPDLEKLRRFGLAIGLVLITYSVAGIRLKEGAEVSPFGFPFTIERPDLLPVGLMLASLYGLLRFLWYGVMLTKSPRRIRKQFEEAAWKEVVLKDRDAIHDFHRDFNRAFPSLLGQKASLKTPSSQDVLVRAGGPASPINDVVPPEKVGVRVNVTEVKVPKLVRVACWVQDIDYTAPIWLNVVALLLATVQLIRG